MYKCMTCSWKASTFYLLSRNYPRHTWLCHRTGWWLCPPPVVLNVTVFEHSEMPPPGRQTQHAFVILNDTMNSTYVFTFISNLNVLFSFFHSLGNIKHSLKVNMASSNQLGCMQLSFIHQTRLSHSMFSSTATHSAQIMVSALSRMQPLSLLAWNLKCWTITDILGLCCFCTISSNSLK